MNIGIDLYPMKKWENPPAIPPRGVWYKNSFSNMIRVPLTKEGIIYQSVENYYQAHKTDNLEERKYIASVNPYQAKKLGKKVKLRDDWNLNLEVSIMKEALLLKWNQEPFRSQLEELPDTVVEWNNWNDSKWGVPIWNQVGRNILGILLMEVREELLNAANINT
jgi:ribA/ribD-fused uncharacterized protein